MPAPLPYSTAHLNLRLAEHDLLLLRAVYPRRVNEIIRLLVTIHCDGLRKRGITLDAVELPSSLYIDEEG